MAAKLTLEIHKHTDMFSDVIPMVGIVNSSGVSTVTTSTPHGLTVGDPVYIADVIVPISITSITRLGTVGTLVTSADHDLTLPIAPTISITADDAEFTGTFTTINIVNRRTITFTMADSGPLLSTGAELHGAARYDQQYNGLQQVAGVTDTSTFTFNNSSNIDATIMSGNIKTNMRVSASATMERALEAYTTQDVEKAWLFVVLGDTIASKSRRTQTDLTDNTQRGEEYRQQLRETVSIVLIANTKDEIAARKIRDEAVDLLVHITKSITFYRFPTNMYVGHCDPLVFVSHGMLRYDSAVYAHGYDFECSTEMDVNDTVHYDPDVAFRDIDLTQYPNLGGTGFMTALINLDDEEL